MSLRISLRQQHKCCCHQNQSYNTQQKQNNSSPSLEIQSARLTHTNSINKSRFSTFRQNVESQECYLSISSKNQSKNSSHSKLSNMCKCRHSSKRNNCENCSNINRSCSRQKILDNKIERMLKEQQQKIAQITNKQNIIRFNNNFGYRNLQSQLLQNQIQFKNQHQYQLKLSQKNQQKQNYQKMSTQKCFLQQSCQQNKQNNMNLNRQINFNKNQQSLQFDPIQTMKSNKLSLRHYINSTPQKQQKPSPFMNQNINISESKQSELGNLKNNPVLKQVRELKGMFIQLLNEKSEVKTRRKTSHYAKDFKDWTHQSKQVFTLP